MYINRILLLALVILYAFAPVMAGWVDASDTQWFTPHMLWLCVIMAVALAMSQDARDER
jgi:sugar phosphate permease